jgi:hypothetical protein
MSLIFLCFWTFPQFRANLVFFKIGPIAIRAHLMLRVSRQNSLTFLRQWVMNLVHYESKAAAVGKAVPREVLGKGMKGRVDNL